MAGGTGAWPELSRSDAERAKDPPSRKLMQRSGRVLVGAARGWVRALLLFYPRVFRRRFHADMANDFTSGSGSVRPGASLRSLSCCADDGRCGCCGAP